MEDFSPVERGTLPIDPSAARATRRWSDIATEPNSHEAKRFRLATLAAAHAPPAASRVDYLGGLVRGKRVLDVGSVAHVLETEAKEEWLHRALAAEAAYCLGIDILPEAVRRLQDAGYNVRLCDVTREEIGETFDVIVAGELIEHLGNPGALFEAARRILVPGGRLVLTTPSPYYWKRIRNHIGLRRNRCESVDHVTLLFPSGVAEFAERAGLRLARYRGVRVGKRRGRREGLGLRVREWAQGHTLEPEFFCETIIYECERPPAA
jgi:SAM-dependent methyltransferase